MPSLRALRTRTWADSESRSPSFGADDVGRDADASRLWPGGVQARTPTPVLEVNEPTDVIPGDSSTTFSLALGAVETGVVNTPGDDDWFAVNLVAGQSYVFTLTGSGGAPLEDPYLQLYSGAGALIAIDDDAGPDINSLLRFTATQTGVHYINARAWEDEAPDLTGGYTITFNTGPAQNPLDTIDLHFTMPTSNITIYFAGSGESYGPPGADPDVAARDWNPNEISAVFAALATFSAVSPLTFSQTTNQAAANWTLTLDTDLGEGVLGHFYAGAPGYGAFNPNGSGWAAVAAPGSLGWVTLIHEFLHGLGLAHPHDNGAVNYGVNNSEIMQGVISEFSSFGTFQLNQGVFTTMTYNDGWVTSPFPANGSSVSGSQATPMALDIALLQQRYGVNATTNSGNTTYILTGAAGAYSAIWDVSGVDAIQYSGSGNATIDLRPATLLNQVGGGGYVSHANNAHQGFTIANGVVIENAIGGSGVDTLIGNDAANELTGNDGGDTLNGGGGNDVLRGGVGDDAMAGGLGDDYYYAEHAGDTITELAGQGTDTIETALANYLMPGNTENLILTGSADINATGNDGANVMTGNAGANVLSAAAGADTLNGGDGADTLNGGDGNDVLRGGVGNDGLAGGLDDDYYYAEHAGDVITELAGQGTDTIETALASYVMPVHTENLILTGSANIDATGNDGANVMTGNGGANVLIGGDGNDTLNGGLANDTLDGGDGNDVLRGGFGNDAMTGGLGDDYYYHEHAGDTITELVGQGTDTVETALANYVMVAHTENLVLAGSANINATGTTAANVMTGNSGANTLIGGLGDDVLQGLGGKDLLTGGGGLDRFVFTSLSDSAVAFAGREAINTFAHGDKIDLSAIDANTTIAGNQAFSWTPGGFTGVAGQLYVQQNASHSYTVWADVNGDAVADFALNIYGAPALNAIFAWDFIL